MVRILGNRECARRVVHWVEDAVIEWRMDRCALSRHRRNFWARNLCCGRFQPHNTSACGMVHCVVDCVPAALSDMKVVKDLEVEVRNRMWSNGTHQTMT